MIITFQPHKRDEYIRFIVHNFVVNCAKHEINRFNKKERVIFWEHIKENYYYHYKLNQTQAEYWYQLCHDNLDLLQRIRFNSRLIEEYDNNKIERIRHPLASQELLWITDFCDIIYDTINFVVENFETWRKQDFTKAKELWDQGKSASASYNLVLKNHKKEIRQKINTAWKAYKREKKFQVCYVENLS